MKTFALLLLLLFAKRDNDTVFICDSPSSEVYHLDENCQGLKKCKHEVKTVTLEKAKELKRRLCGFEDEK